ncbi:MAG TPA: hypothetical protein VN131_01470, partial [Mobilitalea sp.]|nr:hypothetical protein [Mobilitalea sp.]
MKEQNKAGFRPITSLLIGLAFLTVVLIVTMLNASRDMAPSTGTQNDLSQGGVSATPEALYDSELLGVVKGIDETNQLVTVFDIKTGQDVILNYTGGSDIQDKYGQIITMSQMPIGSMVDVGYSKDDEKLVKMHISNKAWVYADVNNLNIDQDKHIMQVADTKYKYSDNIQVFNEDKLIPVSDLAEQDVLTLWGYDQTVWSITVVKGHGTVKLADYDAFLDGNVTVGYEAMQQITDDTLITVREGNYNLTVENGDFSATKNVTVTRGKETVVSLADLGPEAVKKGKITFDITPFGADLFVDGELTSYANPIELPYGDHDIKVSLGGYTT